MKGAVVKTITVNMLHTAGACAEQVEEFERRFPEGVVFASLEDAMQQCVAAPGVFDWGGAAAKLLTFRARRKYVAADARAWAVYRAAVTTAWEDYQAAPATKQSWAVYDAAVLAARKAYTTEEARIFAEAFFTDAGPDLP